MNAATESKDPENTALTRLPFPTIYQYQSIGLLYFSEIPRDFPTTLDLVEIGAFVNV